MPGHTQAPVGRGQPLSVWNLTPYPFDQLSFGCSALFASSLQNSDSLITPLYTTMTLNSHDNVVLVAPRPVRLAAPAPFSQYHHAAASFLHRPQAINAVRFMSPSADAFDRLKLSDDASDEDPRSETPAPSERDRSVSPRASPRYVHPL